MHKVSRLPKITRDRAGEKAELALGELVPSFRQELCGSLSVVREEFRGRLCQVGKSGYACHVGHTHRGELGVDKVRETSFYGEYIMSEQKKETTTTKRAPARSILDTI